MSAPAASVAAVMEVLLCKRQPAFNRCAVHEFRTWDGQWNDRGCPVAVAAADAAVEAAAPGIPQYCQPECKGTCKVACNG